MGRNARGRQAVVRQHPLDRVEAVKRRRIEGRAQEAARVLGIADASRRQAQILELGEPAGDRRPRTEARRRVEEGAAFARHRIFVAAAEVEGGSRGGLAERPLERHEGVIAVDHDPRPVGPAERGQLLDPVEDAPASEQHLADEDEIVIAARAAAQEARRRSRRTARRRRCSSAIQPSSAQRANWRRALWNSPSLVSTRSGPARARGAAVDQPDEEIVGVGREDDRRRASPVPSSRATWACASGQTSSITLSHLRSARRAASFHASTCPSKLASGHR